MHQATRFRFGQIVWITEIIGDGCTVRDEPGVILAFDPDFGGAIDGTAPGRPAYGVGDRNGDVEWLEADCLELVETPRSAFVVVSTSRLPVGVYSDLQGAIEGALRHGVAEVHEFQLDNPQEFSTLLSLAVAPSYFDQN